MGGTNVSAGMLIGAAGGLRHAAKITDAKLQALGGNKQGVSTLNAVNMLGWTGDTMNEGLAKSIWNDNLKVSYGDTEGYGEYKLGGDTLLISSTLLGGGAEGSAKLAAVFAHEGTHAFGNRVEGIAHMQAAGTYDVINRMFDLKADGQFSNEMINGMLDSRSWVENTGDTDYWKLTADGGLDYDGDGWLKDEEGKYINKDGSKSVERIEGNTVGSEGIETGLMKILALEDTKEKRTQVQNMMIESGLVHTVDPNNPDNRDTWMWKGTGTEVNGKLSIGQSLLAEFGMVHLPRTMFSLSEQYAALKFRQLANAQTTSDDDV